MNIEELLERCRRRHGLEYHRPLTIASDYVEAILTIPGSDAYAGFHISTGALFAADHAAEPLVEYEMHAAHEALLVEWQYQQLRRRDPDVPRIDRHRYCPVHANNIIVTIDRGNSRSFTCDGPDVRTEHPLPDRFASARGGLLIVEEKRHG